MTSWTNPEIVGLRALLSSRPRGASLEEQRASLDSLGDRASLPSGCRHEHVAAGGVISERVTPTSAQKPRAILYLHGGGYNCGSPKSHRALAARLGQAACAEVIVVGYRLAPEHPFPAAVDDALAVYRWLLEREGAGPDQIVIAGDSAGGGLAFAAALAIRDAGLPQPAGILAISPWADLTQSSETYRTKIAEDPTTTKATLDACAADYMGDMDRHNPLASPVFGDFTGLAPSLIQVGSVELLLGDSLWLAQRAGMANVAVRLEIWPEMIHVWHGYGGQLKAARQAIADAGDWMRSRFGHP